MYLATSVKFRSVGILNFSAGVDTPVGVCGGRLAVSEHHPHLDVTSRVPHQEVTVMSKPVSIIVVSGVWVLVLVVMIALVQTLDNAQEQTIRAWVGVIIIACGLAVVAVAAAATLALRPPDNSTRVTTSDGTVMETNPSDVLLEIVRKLPWVVITGLLLVYGGLVAVGTDFP